MSKIQPVSPGRVRLTSHSTNISNVLLLEYHQLSDGAKLTYMVLESYDWPDEQGFSKGKCWPTIESLASARNKSYDTIARHLKELEAAGLIRVESGQERGAANCYWLLGPCDSETEAYMARYAKKPAKLEVVRFEEPDEIPPLPPQNSGTGYRKNTEPGTVKMPEKEPEFQIKNPKEKKDSNPLRGLNPGGKSLTEKVGKQSQSVYLNRLMDDFSRALNDTENAPSNRTQVNNLFVQSGLSEQNFVELLYEAKKRTQWAALATGSTTRTGPNRAAYFFRVVRSLLSENLASAGLTSVKTGVVVSR